MLRSYTIEAGRAVRREGLEAAVPALARAVWVDLLNPTPEEESAVQMALRLEVPTREEMQEIESSSRLYREDDALFLTASFLYGTEGDFGSTAISFVLAGPALVTVRYATPRAFDVFAHRLQRQPGLAATPDAVMLVLFEQVVDRLADILEKVGADMDRASQSAFRGARETKVKASKRDADLKGILVTLGEVGEVTARATETLLGLSRILSFVTAEKAVAVRKENQGLIKTLVRDVRSLVEHANFLNSRANFLLDAVLGLINADQSGIIKTFTVASVALMPPTLIASIYGMNFQYMPELGWRLGYPLAVLLMVGSAALPIVYFKRKGWL